MGYAVYPRLGILVAGLVLLAPAPAGAQAVAPPAQPQSAVVAALSRDIGEVSEKLVALGEAIPEAKFGWRPGEGVRSVNEVVKHLVAENYFLPAVTGAAAPAGTGITGNDYATVQAYEARVMTRAEALSALRESLGHLRAVVQATDDAFLARSLSVFGMPIAGLDLWVMTATHLHEHLGQLIAYARMNGIVPPWSR